MISILHLSLRSSSHRLSDHLIPMLLSGAKTGLWMKLTDGSFLPNMQHFTDFRIAGLYQIKKDTPDSMRQELGRLTLTSSDCRFLSFVRYFDRPFSRGFIDRIVTAYWEFTFISSKRHRLASWLHLLFPPKGLLTNIYRIKSTASIIFFYPLNFLISGLTSILFGLLYLFVCIKNAIVHE